MPERTENRCSNKSLCKNVHSSTCDNSQQVETAQMSTEWWPRKQNAVHIHAMRCYSATKKKKRGADACFDTDEPWKHNAKWRRPGAHTKARTVWFHLSEIARTSTPLETDSRVMAAGAGEGTMEPGSEMVTPHRQRTQDHWTAHSKIVKTVTDSYVYLTTIFLKDNQFEGSNTKSS